MTEIVETEGQCRSCGRTTTLERNGWCAECWTVVEHKRQLLLTKGTSPKPPSTKPFRKLPPTEKDSESPSIYYVMRKGELVEATADEFLAAIAGGRYYK